MTEIRTETFPLTDGSELRLTVAEPETAVRGGLVVLHEARGVTDAVRGLVSSLAQEGWLAVVPHLYHRDGADELDAADGDDRVRDQVNRLSGESVLADTDASFVWLAERGVRDDQMGVVGYGLGGSVAMVVAASRSLGAAVTIGGGGILSPVSEGLPSLVDVAGELTCPWLGIYTEADPSIPHEDVEKLREAAAAAGVATDVVRYPAPVDPAEDDAKAAADAWQRTLNWFDSHLR
ncbi:dienelactone hydrolase family protein [Streptoalloteichus hindustanus]|uniref:Carboxymethylenebutenolidase n=1 Tax=Streptoalloteichus hindustanus TaxID=2017 RepID=A0A1M4VM42_STRHI|nr:dienelactone hydrolase family protein [Streptoalloteichus hindustanus]SHE69925.1 carboxymethylenebutenolidase [Streptoalloteichus hindustanus]